MNKLLTSLLAISLLWLTSCATEATPLTARQQAETLLQQGRYIEANAIVEKLLLDSPDDQQLHLLAGLAAFGEMADQINFVTTLVFAILDDLSAIADVSADDGYSRESIANENEFVLNLITSLVEYLREPVNRAVEHLAQVTDPDTSVDLPDFKVRFWQVDMFDMSGTWTAADAQILGGLLAPVAGSLDVLAAHDFNTDAYYAVHRFLGTQFKAEERPEYLNVAVNLLASEEYPNFLKLRSDQGAAMMELARLQFERTGAMFVQGIALAQDAAKPDTAIFAVYEDEDGTVLELRDRVLMTEDGVLDINFRHTADTSYQTMSFRVTQGWLDAATKFRDAMQADAGAAPRFTLRDDILPPVAALVLGILPHLNLSSTVRGAVELLGDDPDSAVAVVADFIPEGLSLDLRTWLGSGVGLRAIVPAYRTDLGEFENNFLLEWECPAEFAPTATAPVGSTASMPLRLVCDEEAAMLDRGHFYDQAFTDASVESIDDDDLAVALPLIAFGDASLGGLIWIDGQALELDGESNAPANNRTLNAYIATVYEQIADLLSDD